MIARETRALVELRLAESPAVALLGPRQVGKTTLALDVAAGRGAVYLDLEAPADRAKVADVALYLAGHRDKLVIFDEVHRLPGLFESLRGLIDQNRRDGRGTGRYLLLGSASLDLLRQSGESLAGRIAYVELGPLTVGEVDPAAHHQLWVRGGFPESFLARSDPASLRWRQDFIRTYLERDIPQLGPRIAAETLRRFWTMLAHHQGGLHNAATLARGLGVDGKTVAAYADLLVDLLLVRRLPPWHANTGKRLVKSPRLYVRDTGLLHALLGIGELEGLLGHPIVGASWEGFAVESLCGAAPAGTVCNFYRTAAGAEADLVLTLPDGRVWVVEIKRSLSPALGRGFHAAGADVGAVRAFCVYSGTERYPLAEGVEAISLIALRTLLRGPEALGPGGSGHCRPHGA